MDDGGARVLRHDRDERVQLLPAAGGVRRPRAAAGEVHGRHQPQRVQGGDARVPALLGAEGLELVLRGRVELALGERRADAQGDCGEAGAAAQGPGEALGRPGAGPAGLLPQGGLQQVLRPGPGGPGLLQAVHHAPALHRRPHHSHDAGDLQGPAEDGRGHLRPRPAPRGLRHPDGALRALREREHRRRGHRDGQPRGPRGVPVVPRAHRADPR
mmetsp:Transcript_108010/g.328308  ORF Transcript_108010/g.328308 Transcript_108010/m.328308 type:complete len:214 (-) Transcript_108010:44-685(-)